MHITQSNNLTTLEWLNAPLSQQLNAIYDYSFTNVNEYLLYISAEYKNIRRVFTIAKVPEFERLAATISFVAEQVANKEVATLFLPVVLHASKLLQYEFNHFIKSGYLRYNLLNLRAHYLQLVMVQMGIDVPPENIWQAARDIKFSEQVEFDDLTASDSLTDGEFERLNNDWHALAEKLLDHQQNITLILTGLRTITLRLTQVSSGILKKLWLFSLILIDNIANNLSANTNVNDATTGTLREDDRYILLKLERAFHLDFSQDLPILDVLWLENAFIDLYINLASLPKKDKAAQKLLNNIDDGVILEQTLFTYAVDSLQQTIKALDEDRICFDILNKLHKRLESRGWTFYARELEDVIDYATGANISEESFDVIKENLVQRITKLIGTIEKTHQAIQTNGFNEVNSDSSLGMVSIALEEIKNSFITYLDTKNLNDLPDNDSLEQLNYYFEEMKLTKVAEVSRHLGNMFSTLAQKAPTRISWQLAHDIADGLALFEMFLDNLSRQVFDDALLIKTQESIDASFAIINDLEDKNEDVLELFDIYVKLLKSHENTILYDDNGEKQPVSGEVIHTYTLNPGSYRDTDDVEDVIFVESKPKPMIQKFIHSGDSAITSITTVPHFQTNYQPEIKTASDTLLNDESKSHDILLTDILSLPSISLSDGDNNNNHLANDAVKAMNLVGSDDTKNNTSESPNSSVSNSQNLLYDTIKANIKADDFSFDAEFREIFVEEADEVIDEIHVHLATLNKKGVNDLPSLKEIRRGYHTLKGSGRMVGAYNVGETAWSIENMLNRVLDHSINSSQEMVGLVVDATDIMPIMVQDFAAGNPPSVDNLAIIAQAQNLLKGRPLKEGLPTKQSLNQPAIQVEVDTEVLVSNDFTKDAVTVVADTIAEELLTTKENVKSAAPDEQLDDNNLTTNDLDIQKNTLDENTTSDTVLEADFDAAIFDIQTLSAEDEALINTDLPIQEDIKQTDDLSANDDEVGLQNNQTQSDILLDEFSETEDLMDENLGAENLITISEKPSDISPDIANKSDQNESGDLGVLLPFMEEAQKPLVSTLGDVDDDIKEIFIEEAHEVLDDIVPMFKSYLADRSQAGLLVDVRRGFHTLKGSGRMVGAMELGELAWAVENMMNRILDKTITLNEGMCTLIYEVLAEFSGLVAIFEHHKDSYPEKMLLWRAACHAYSKGLADKFDYRVFANADYVVADWQLDDGFEKPEIAELRTKSSLQALSSLQQIGELIQNAPAGSAESEEEEMLCGIFIEEGKELLAQVKAFLEENKNAVSVPVNDKIVRVFHTLRGASGLAPLTGVGEVGAIIERVLQDLQQHETPMTQTHLSALHEAVLLIEAHLAAYENPEEDQSHQQMEEDKQLLQLLLPKDDQKELGVSELIQGIDTLIDAEIDLKSSIATDSDIVVYANQQLAEIEVLSARTQNRRKFQRVLSALRETYQLAQQYPACMHDEFVEQLLNVHHQLIGLFDSLAGSMSLHLDDEVLQALNDNVVKHTVDYHRQEHLKETAQLENQVSEILDKPQQTEETLIFENIYTDDELLQIFLDEALSLDESMTQVVVDWHQNPKNNQYVQSLYRYVHTIQGGARLAGIMSVGDLADEIEAVFQKLLDKKIIASAGWVTIISQLMDVLSLQLEMINSKKQSFFAERTISELHQYLSMVAVPDDAAVYAPVIEETDEPEEDEFIDDDQTDNEATQSQPALVDVKKLIEDSWQGNVPDMDILEVFLEEAKDLAESSSEEFGVFRNDTTDSQTLHSLQRKLHTIKGGARMVSANGMADLAHEMETIYEDLGHGRKPVTPMITQLLYACHDWISAAVGLLEQQYNPPRPTELIEALHQFIQNPDSLTHVPQVSLERDLEALTAKPVLDTDYQAEEEESSYSIEKMPPMKGVFGEQTESTTAAEMIRISAPLMEEMINLSGEAAINRARIEMNMVSLTGNIEEMGATAQRLSDQLRRMDIELEAQIIAQLDEQELDAGFDPLEMDQYSSLNQLSKSLAESASDILDIKTTLLEKTRDSENLLLQLARTQAKLQDNLMNSRMVPFSRLTPRLQRIVRQTAGELGKSVELTVINADDEMDRNILDRITSPLEHMLRNAIDHGIEYPDYRSEIGKSATGQVVLEVQREGNEVVILLSDDGAGVDVEAVRKKAIAQGLIRPDERLSDNDIMQYIFNAGLSTTNKITQISGRGVGMDVVRAQVRELGGTVAIESERGKGSKFIIRVPLTVAMSDTLVVRVGDRQYAIPLIQIDRVVQVDLQELKTYYRWNKDAIIIEDKPYRLRYLDEILNNNDFSNDSESSLPVIIIKNRVGQHLALQVDEIVGSRTEVVVKPLGRQLSHLSGISAATIMGDGSVMLILDLLALMRVSRQRRDISKKVVKASHRDLIMVVDDSVTVRKVTSRFLERHGFDVVVAKDGVDAVEKLQDTLPDLMLLDIEMPRMDGFEVATQIRNSDRLKNLPIVMITSRTGEKHRERAFDIGVNDYMGKPFQEADLLARIHHILDLQDDAD